MTTTETNYYPVLYQTEMVQAILEDRKEQTRRLFKKIPRLSSDLNWAAKFLQKNKELRYQYSPYGKPGDVLWVRETFREVNHYGFDYEFYEYKAGGTSAHCFIPDMDQLLHDDKWKPSIHMPKEAARIFLEVTDVRIEKLQNISEKDAIAEGVHKHSDYGSTGYVHYGKPDESFTDIDAVWSFETLWESINGSGSWNKNPWVWVIEFKKIEKPENFLS